MRKHRFDLGPGWVHVLDAPDEVDALPKRLRALVPPAMIDRWRAFPRSFEDLAERATIPELAAWLRDAAKSRACVAVYDPKAGMPPRAFLELDFGLRSTAGGDLRWAVLLDCHTGTPPCCPPELTEVYAATGGVATQYGASGTLIAPDEVTTLAAWSDSAPHLFDPEMGAELTLTEAEAWHPYFEADGDYLCYRADGMSRWFGFEWGNAGELVPTRTCVEDLFQPARETALPRMRERPRPRIVGPVRARAEGLERSRRTRDAALRCSRRRWGPIHSATAGET